MAARAGIVVTGTEVLTGRVTDRNGPWLAEQLRQGGVDVGQIVVVGDRPDDLRTALVYLLDSGVDLVITSGGLGPTADDLTAQIVGEVQGRPSQLDEAVEQHIAAIVTRLQAARGWQTDPESTAAATRKQALVPEGATVLTPVGTAPGLIVPAPAGSTRPPVVVLPGPPAELQGMWPAVMADATVRAALRHATELRQDTLRLWGVPESELAATLRAVDADIQGLEITTCLRQGELEIVSRYPPDAAPAQAALAQALRSDFSRQLFSPDGRTVDDIVADGVTDRGLTVAVAESCTGGLLLGRLTGRPGSSRFLTGGTVVYSNEAKTELLGVPGDLIERVGAVSEEVARAMAAGVRARFGADVGVGVTGIAGPDGGTAAKPVGLVHLAVSDVHDGMVRETRLGGDRASIRVRAVSEAMHLLREFLARTW